MALQRVELQVIGSVQGVFFRMGVKEVADWLRVTGWVRNEPDGSVKIIAEGEEGDLQKLIVWCRKGTDGARVDDMSAIWQEARGEFNNFEIQ